MALNAGNPDPKLSPKIQRTIAADVELIKSTPPEVPYAKPPKAKGEGKNAKDVRDKNAPHAEKPTTASGEVGEKDLPSVLKKVDPNNLSSVLPSMFQLLSLINSTMNSSSQSARKPIIQDSLTGALAILNKKYGYEKVINAFNKALENEGINKINADYRDIVKNALANFIKDAIKYGPANIPVSITPGISYTIILPVPIVAASEVPDLSLQQYYTTDTDPYPGYIQWLLPEGTLSSVRTNFVYTRRTPDQPPYASADEEIYSISEKELANDLDPYIRDQNLTAEILNSLLIEQDNNVKNNGMERSVGKNSSVNLMSLLSAALGILGGIINNTISGQLPQSVLQQGSVNQSLEKFSTNMAMLKNMKQNAESAFRPQSPLGALPNINALVANLTGNLLSQFGVSIPNLNAITSNINNINVPSLTSATGLNISNIQSVVNQVEITRQLIQKLEG